MCLIASTWTKNADMVVKVIFRRMIMNYTGKKVLVIAGLAFFVVILLLIYPIFQTPVPKVDIVGDYDDVYESVIKLDSTNSVTKIEAQTSVSPTSAAYSSGWQKTLCSMRVKKPAFPFFVQHFKPEESDRNIFFIETSCASSLNAKMACAVESAARHHEHHVVHLLMTSPYISGANTLIHTLASLPNVRLAVGNIDDIFKGTPLQEWNQKLTWASNTEWPMINLSDGLRLALVCHYGGVYLDLDMLILAPLPVDEAWIGREKLKHLSNGGFKFPRNHWFCQDAFSNFLKNYNGRTWSNNGPKLFLRVIEGHCGKIANISNCRDIHLLEPAALYPEHWKQWTKFFEPEGGSKWIIEKPKVNVAIHLWNKMSHGRPIAVGDNSVIDLVAKENCPSVYAATKVIYKFKYIIEGKDKM